MLESQGRQTWEENTRDAWEMMKPCDSASRRTRQMGNGRKPSGEREGDMMMFSQRLEETA